MGKYLAILNGAADEADKEGLSEHQQAELLSAWASWAQEHERALVDPGAPLFRKKRLTAHEVRDVEDAKVAYLVVDADSHDSAVQMFKEHPHLSLAPGNSIDVIECPALPG